MRVIAILQARTGSSRLPGKVIEDLHGAPVVARCIERLKRCSTLDEIVLATTTEPRDDVLQEIAVRMGIPYHRGPEQDVLTRYVNAAQEQSADVVARITSDCPLLMPDVVDRAVRALGREHDLVSNSIERTFPRGCDVEVAHFDVLHRTHRLATSQPAREHVFWYCYQEAPSLFRIRHIKDRQDLSHMSWTLDTAADLARIRLLWPLIGEIYEYDQALARLELRDAA